MKAVHYTVAVIISTVLMLGSLALAQGLVMDNMVEALAGAASIVVVLAASMAAVEYSER